MISIDDRADGASKLKEAIEKEFYESFKRCACCQRPGEWKKKCGRCKVNYYCSRECQKWHWDVHKKHCVPFGTAPAPKAKPAPAPAPAPKVEEKRVLKEFDMTDAQLRVSYLEGCGDVDAAVAHLRRRLEAWDSPLAAALVTGAGGQRCVMESPSGAALEPDAIVQGHARPALDEMKRENPRCSLAYKATKDARVFPPLTATAPSFPKVAFDAAIPTAFVGFSGLNEDVITALADPNLLKSLAGNTPAAFLAGYDQGSKRVRTSQL